MRRHRSAIFAAALDAWAECREAYALHLEAQYAAAVDATNGVLLNARGRAEGVASPSLFLGPRSRAEAFASAELREFWSTHPRVTFAQFERDWWNGQGGGSGFLTGTSYNA